MGCQWVLLDHEAGLLPLGDMGHEQAEAAELIEQHFALDRFVMKMSARSAEARMWCTSSVETLIMMTGTPPSGTGWSRNQCRKSRPDSPGRWMSEMISAGISAFYLTSSRRVDVGGDVDVVNQVDLLERIPDEHRIVRVILDQQNRAHVRADWTVNCRVCVDWPSSRLWTIGSPNYRASRVDSGSCQQSSLPDAKAAVMIVTKMALPRGTFLSGTGVTLRFRCSTRSCRRSPDAEDAAAAVRRMGFVYVPNGVAMTTR